MGKDGQKAAFVIFTLHWRGIYFVWPFVSDDLGRRTAKTQASVKIKLVSTYSLNPPHLTRIPFVFPMHGCGWVFHTIVITFLGAARKWNKWKAVTELENHLRLVSFHLTVRQQFQNFMRHKGQIFNNSHRTYANVWRSDGRDKDSIRLSRPKRLWPTNFLSLLNLHLGRHFNAAADDDDDGLVVKYFDISLFRFFHPPCFFFFLFCWCPYRPSFPFKMLTTFSRFIIFILTATV